MKTLKLFNAVISKDTNQKPFLSEDGYIIEPQSMWAKDNIIKHYQTEKLNGNDLNKTFHKSWFKIQNSSRTELLIEQLKHYVSTYGSDFKTEMYIPNEILNVPDLKLTYKVIKSYSIDEMTNKCLQLLCSGIALKEETIDDLLSILTDELDYVFTGNENIKNKEAIIKIADLYNILPNDTMEFFRYIIYKTTGESLLIKSDDLILKIKESTYNPSVQFRQFGLIKLSEIFNRFKPLFLSYKGKCSKTINKISKLSKKHHKPLVSNPLNSVTNTLLTDKDYHWLENATTFSIFKALSACYLRINGQDSFVYRIRNGKSWTKETKSNININSENYNFLIEYLKTKVDLTGKKIFIPKNIQYALPTSEKMFVGNIPTGTKFYGDKMAVGMYWENNWGARDLDLSGLNIGGKIGWNTSYNYDNVLMYSGDITDAPNGAVEYLYANKGLDEPTLVYNNVFTGSSDCKYKIIIGSGDDVSNDYMMNPNNLMLDVKTQSIQNQMILGIFLPTKTEQCFVLLNFGSGNVNVSSSVLSNISTKALYQQWNSPLTFNEIVNLLGAEIINTEENSDYNLSVDKLEIDTFTKLFT